MTKAESRKAYLHARYILNRERILAQQKEYASRPERKARKAAQDRARYERMMADPELHARHLEQVKAAPAYAARFPNRRQPAKPRYRRTRAERLAELAARPRAPKKRYPDLRRVRKPFRGVMGKRVIYPQPLRIEPAWEPQPVSRWEPGLDKGYDNLMANARAARTREMVA